MNYEQMELLLPPEWLQGMLEEKEEPTPSTDEPDLLGFI
jgi:hypothetical protein